jgi:hypothetical protein
LEKGAGKQKRKGRFLALSGETGDRKGIFVRERGRILDKKEKNIV